MRRALAAAMFGLVTVVAGLEILCRWLPVSTATMTGYDLAPGVLTYPARHRWTVSTGWDLRNPQQVQANGSGFVSHREFVPDPTAVALVGDSYVESSMLDPADRPGLQLERLLSGRKVYPLGGPGSSLLDYATRIRLARDRWEIRTFAVLLEATDATQALCGSGNVHGRCLDRQTLSVQTQQTPPPGLAKRVLRHSALAQYLVGQVNVASPALWRRMFVRTTPEESSVQPAAHAVAPAAAAGPDDADLRRKVKAVVDQFYLDLPTELHRQVVFAVDGYRGHGPRLSASADMERRILMDVLKARGARVEDLEATYARHAAESGLWLRVGPHDGHLNPHGVGLVMKALADYL